MKRIKIKVIGAKDFYIVPDQFFNLKDIIGKKLKPIKAKIIGAKDFYIKSEVFIPEGIPTWIIEIPLWTDAHPNNYNYYSFGENPSPFPYIKRKILYSPKVALKIAEEKILNRGFRVNAFTNVYSHFHPKIVLKDMTRWVDETSLNKWQARFRLYYPTGEKFQSDFKKINDNTIKVPTNFITNPNHLLTDESNPTRILTFKIYPWGDFQVGNIDEENDTEVWIGTFYVSAQFTHTPKWITESITVSANADWVEKITDENNTSHIVYGRVLSWNDEDFGDRTGTIVEGETFFYNNHTFKAERITSTEEGFVRHNMNIGTKIHPFYKKIFLPIRRQKTWVNFYFPDPTNYPAWFSASDIQSTSQFAPPQHTPQSWSSFIQVPYESYFEEDIVQRSTGNKIKAKLRNNAGHPYYDVAISSVAFPTSGNIFVFPDNFPILSTTNSIFLINLATNEWKEYRWPFNGANDLKNGYINATAYDDNTNNRRVMRIFKIFEYNGDLQGNGIRITLPLSVGSGAEIKWAVVKGDFGTRAWFIGLKAPNWRTYENLILFIGENFPSFPIKSYANVFSYSYLLNPRIWASYDENRGVFIFSQTAILHFLSFDLGGLNIYSFNLPIDPIRLIKEGLREIVLENSAGNRRIYGFPIPFQSSFNEYSINQNGGIRGNVPVEHLWGYYDNSNNVFLAGNIANDFPGYGLFPNWGGRLIWTKSLSSTTQQNLTSVGSVTWSSLPSNIQVSYEIGGILYKLNEGTFSWFPNT